MRHPSRIAQLALAALAGALLAGGGYALASSSTAAIHGCVSNKNHQLLIERRCGKGQSRLVWNQQGPQGRQGAAGPQGRQGVQGPVGLTGAQGAVGASAFVLWARVSSSGSVVAGSSDPEVGSLAVGHLETGEYQLIPQEPPGAPKPPCAVTVTPDAVSTDGLNQPATPITATVGASGLSQPGAEITVLLNDSTSGVAVDDGFSVIADC
jgi:hypothetical protein